MQKSMLKPPITRLGGKSKSRKEIISMMPDHVCYVELDGCILASQNQRLK